MVSLLAMSNGHTHRLFRRSTHRKLALHAAQAFHLVRRFTEVARVEEALQEIRNALREGRCSE